MINGGGSLSFSTRTLTETLFKSFTPKIPVSICHNENMEGQKKPKVTLESTSNSSLFVDTLSNIFALA
jgi:hypothetical protein